MHFQLLKEENLYIAQKCLVPKCPEVPLHIVTKEALIGRVNITYLLLIHKRTLIGRVFWVILYSGNVWQRESLANLASRPCLAKL